MRGGTRQAFSLADRDAALARAEIVGTTKAAAEIGASASTLRAWRHRKAKRGVTAAPVIASLSQTGTADALTARAVKARADEQRTLGRVEKFMQEGDAKAGQAASRVATDYAARAVSLEQAAAHAREHEARMREAETRLTDGQVWTFERVVQLFVTALGLSWAPEHEDLVTALLAALCDGERDGAQVSVTIPEVEAEVAREAVEAVWRGAARKDALAELAAAEPDDAEQAPETKPAGMDYQRPIAPEGGEGPDLPVAVSSFEDFQNAAPEPDELPPWDALPEDWQARFALNRYLGRVEWARHQRRLERDQEQRRLAVARSRHRSPSFRHPGLAGP